MYLCVFIRIFIHWTWDEYLNTGRHEKHRKYVEKSLMQLISLSDTTKIKSRFVLKGGISLDLKISDTGWKGGVCFYFVLFFVQNPRKLCGFFFKLGYQHDCTFWSGVRGRDPHTSLWSPSDTIATKIWMPFIYSIKSMRLISVSCAGIRTAISNICPFSDVRLWRQNELKT